MPAMRYLLIALLSLSLMAAVPEQVNVGAATFQKSGKVWVQVGLPSHFALEKAYAVNYMDEQWNAWYNREDGQLKAILDLGMDVVFLYPGEDNELHVYSVRSANQSKEMATGALTVGTLLATGQLADSQSGGAIIDIVLLDDDTSQDAKR
jgi:hypothetical protein